MKSTPATIKAKVYVFAEPKTKYQLENLEPGELAYRYVVKSYDFGNEDSVRLLEHEIEVAVPGGIDITSACIQNLKERIDAIEKDAKKEIEDLEQRILDLALIEYRPEPEDDGPIAHVVA
jgi:hypothetical protein